MFAKVLQDIQMRLTATWSFQWGTGSYPQFLTARSTVLTSSWMQWYHLLNKEIICSCSVLFFSDVVETLTFETETETWIKFETRPRPRLHQKLWDWDSRLELRDQDRDSRLQHLCTLPIFFTKMSSSLMTWIFFKSLAFFRRDLVVSYLQIQQTKNGWIIEISKNYFFAIFKVSRPDTFETETETETETRPETFETWNLRDLKPSRPETFETWNLRDRDSQKWVSWLVSRPRPSLETPSLLFLSVVCQLLT